MRIITLPSDRDEAKKVFGLFYTAAFSGEGAKDETEGRQLGKLHDALEDVGCEEDVPKDELPEGVDADTRWVLGDDVTTITLEDAHWSLLKNRIYGAGIQWVAAVARKVTAAYDIIEKAEEVKPGEEAPDIGGEKASSDDAPSIGGEKASDPDGKAEEAF